LPSSLHRLALLLLAFGICSRSNSQGTAQTDIPTAPAAHLEPVPRVPGLSALLRGLNAGITASETNDSSIGWYTVITPALNYSFSPHFAADVSASIYPYRKVERPALPPSPPEELVPVLWDAGDTYLAFHARFIPRFAQATTTATLGLPTGSQNDGLGAGKVTYDFSERLLHYFGRTGLFLDAGAGDSSALFNRMISRDYTSVGALTHFQEGAVFWLFGRDSIQVVAYQQEPVGSQTVYTDTGPPGAPGVTVVSGNGLGQDDGVTTAVSIPLSAHLTLSGYYNRSFEQSVDTVSAGFTYVLHGNSRYAHLSMIDKALREAARSE
jgi:hypothetical protein